MISTIIIQSIISILIISCCAKNQKESNLFLKRRKKRRRLLQNSRATSYVPRSRKDEKQFEEQNEETVLAPSIARSPKNSPKKLESPKSKKNGGENCCQIGDDDDLRETQSMGENGRGIDDDWSKNPPHKVTSETEIDDYSEAATKKMNK